jgi:hypothetical protein
LASITFLVVQMGMKGQCSADAFDCLGNIKSNARLALHRLQELHA